MAEVTMLLPRLKRFAGAFLRAPLRTSFGVWFRGVQKLIRMTRLGRVTFYPADSLPWGADLETNWRKVRHELDQVMTNLKSVPNAQDDYQGQHELTQDDKWKTFTLVRGGRQDAQNCARCPETAKLLRRVPDLTNAFFSIMAGPKHLKAHCGPYAGLLNCHLGLLTPPNPADCRIRVGSDVRSWEEGRLTVFDETNEHEVWNDSDHIRVVMIMYVLRPLPLPLAILNKLTIIVAGLVLRSQPDH